MLLAVHTLNVYLFSDPLFIVAFLVIAALLIIKIAVFLYSLIPFI